MNDLTIEPSAKEAFPSFKVEFIAGLSTFLTLSYIFLLNPVMLAKAGINISAAFFATVVSATMATLIMGIWAKLPFAVAPAPSITTFFVSYVCLKMKLPWEAALAAVILSGALSIIMTYISVRGKLIDTLSPALRIGVLFAISGFLIANGFTQAKIVSYPGGFIDIQNFNGHNILILLVGLCVTLLFRLKWFKFSGAPLLGILAASITAAIFGVKASTHASFSQDMFLSVGHVDFSALLDSRFLLAMLVFFIIDFFGGVGKYVGLFQAMGNEAKSIEEKGLGKALYVDGIGNLIGGALGASSLAVFVSSAVGVVAGGRTGITAIVAAGFMLASLFIIPIIGSIPVEATSGILIYVGILLMPYKDIIKRDNSIKNFEIVISVLAAIISFLTYGIDKAILLVFLLYSLVIVYSGKIKDNLILIVTTILLLAAVVAQTFM